MEVLSHLSFLPYRDTWMGFLGIIMMEDNIKIYHVSHPQSKLHMEGFRSLKEGEAVEFTFKKSAKGLESIRVTGPGGVFCIGSERRPKGKNMQKRRSKGDRYGLEGGLYGLRMGELSQSCRTAWIRLPKLK